MSDVVVRALHSAALQGASATFGPGLHVIVGAPADGTADLIEILAGMLAPRRGAARIDGVDPYRSPATRRRTGALLAEERLPARGSVEQAVARALALRGTPGGSPASVLEACGLAAWIPRRTDNLSPEERRAVALALALGHPDPLLVALFEPLARVAGVERARVLSRIRAHAERACVLCATTSAADAAELAGRTWLLERGVFTRTPPPPLARELAPGLPAELVVRTPRARELGAKVALDPAIAAVAWDERAAPDEIRVRGADADAVALAVMRAARAAGIHVEAFSPALPSLEVVRAASAGLARGAYDAAYRVAAGPARNPPGPEGQA